MPRPLIAIVFALGLVLFGQGIYIHAKALLAQVLLQRAFAETIATGHAIKPWSWADTWPVARIEIKRLHASAIVLAGSSGQALAFGPGHVELTPDAGERGVAVYSAHRDTHFRFLKDVAIGDEIAVTRSDGKLFRFRADGNSVVRFDAPGIDPLSNGYQLVLSTCWPFDAVTAGPMRYLLHATLIEDAPAFSISIDEWFKSNFLPKRGSGGALVPLHATSPRPPAARDQIFIRLLLFDR
jgi:sortase A